VGLYATDPAVPVRLHRNRARRSGGAIYVGGDRGGTACVADFTIDSNFAQEGAAIYMDAGAGSLQLNDLASCLPDQDDRSVRCTPGPDCNLIGDNRTEAADGTPTAGAALLLQSGNTLNARRFKLRGNQGAQALRTIDAPFQQMSECELVGNRSSDALVRTSGSQELAIRRCTIAGNEVAGAAVLALGGGLAMEESVVAQPGRTTVSGGGTRAAIDVVATERFSLDGGNTPFVVEADPRLMDIENGDARLHPASAAVDFSGPAYSPGERDIAGNPVGLDVEVLPNRFGPRDLGAHELQAFGNLVRNGEFRLPVACASPVPAIPHWTPVTPGVLACSTDGFEGADAVYVSQTAPAALCETPVGMRPCTLGPRTCVPLPAPGSYRLNGRGRSTGTLAATRDYPRLFWRVRGHSADCSGPELASGVVFLPRGADWAAAAADGVFEVQPQQWTSNASLEVALVVVDGDEVGSNAVDAYFDAVQLHFVGNQNFAPIAAAQIAARSDPEGAAVTQATSQAFSDPNGDVLAYFALSLPPGLSIDAGSGAIAGTLATGGAGEYPVRVTARDPNGATAQVEFGWTVTGGPPLLSDGFE
jgi:predicted outer membrane repeat protein